MATREERKLAGNGGRFVMIGAPLVVIGIILFLVLDGSARGIGAAIGVIGLLPVIVGVVLLLTAGTERASRKDVPYT